jgi:hypothetical protein
MINKYYIKIRNLDESDLSDNEIISDDSDDES